MIFHKAIKKTILSKTCGCKELISDSEGLIELTQFENDKRVIKMNKLRKITEMVLNWNELDNTVNLEDGRPSNILSASREVLTNSQNS